MSQPPLDPPPGQQPPDGSSPDPYRTPDQYPPPGQQPPPHPYPYAGPGGYAQYPVYPVQPGPKRFSGGMIWAGIGLDLLFFVLSGVAAGALAWLPGPGAGIATVVSLVLAFLPLVGGIVLAVIGRTPRGRGLGLGFAIGWAVWLIVGGGVCVALVLSYGLSG